MKTRRKKFSIRDIRTVAVAANVDPRTVAKVIAGEPTRPVARARVERALAELPTGRLTSSEHPEWLTIVDPSNRPLDLTRPLDIPGWEVVDAKRGLVRRKRKKGRTR